MQLETIDGVFTDWAPLKGALLGVIGGFLGFLFIALTAICNKVASSLNAALDRLPIPIPNLGKVLTPAMGGLVVGTIAWIVPGSTGTGESGMIFLSRSDLANEYDPPLFIATGFGKLVALSVCLGEAERVAKRRSVKAQCGFSGESGESDTPYCNIYAANVGVVSNTINEIFHPCPFARHRLWLDGWDDLSSPLRRQRHRSWYRRGRWLEQTPVYGVVVGLPNVFAHAGALRVLGRFHYGL